MIANLETLTHETLVDNDKIKVNIYYNKYFIKIDVQFYSATLKAKTKICDLPHNLQWKIGRTEFFATNGTVYYEPLRIKITNDSLLLMNDTVATEHYQGVYTGMLFL